MRPKRIIAFMIIGCFALAICACGNNSDDSGDSTSQEPISNSQVTLDIPYEDKAAHLVGVHCYQEEIDYEYMMHVVYDIDLSELSEREQHFFGEDMHFDCDLSGGKNDIYSSSADEGEDGVKDNHYYMVFKYPGGGALDCRESLEGTEMNIEVHYKNYDGELLGQTSCIVDSFDTQDEILDIASGAGYVGFNDYGYMKTY